MKISLIAAVSENNVIGDGEKLLWHIPEDFRYFKSTTMGKPIIMGRRTYDSIGRPLPGRLNIVITRNSDWKADGITTAASLEEAIKTAEKQNVSEIFVIGGGQIYAQALPFATSVYLTLVQGVYTGDVRFPALDPKVWQETSRKKGTDCDKVGMNYEFIVYEKVSK
ncbi:MAG: dihydrofolate reductase [Proteobacteria bacterium]|nr:dihydrofolate reductase [Pseudomonadota bacterium]